MRCTLLAILGLAAAVRVANLGLMSRLPIAEYQRTWQESDMAFSWTWSGRILEGDVLGRDTIHPNTQWMRDMAPLESWERWWGGKHVFHQAPLYAYALAAARLVAGAGFGVEADRRGFDSGHLPAGDLEAAGEGGELHLPGEIVSDPPGGNSRDCRRLSAST